MRDADDLVLGYLRLNQRVEDAAQPGRVDADLVQQAGLFDPLAIPGQLFHILANLLDEGQVAVRCEVVQARGDVFAPFQYGRVRPGVAPGHPLAGLSVAADRRRAKQVVQPSAVDAKVNNLGIFQQIVKGYVEVALFFPKIRPCPAVGAQV